MPQFLHGSGEGWITGGIRDDPGRDQHPGAGARSRKGRPSGRTMEIQRLIGRALRSVLDRRALGERTIWIDCEVLQADGGTRCASITGGFVALCEALKKLQAARCAFRRPVLTGGIAAISVGIVEGAPALDLDYVEDSAADVDMNIVRTHDGKFVELQGTAEETPFDRGQLDALIGLADAGIDKLHGIQREVIGSAFDSLIQG